MVEEYNIKFTNTHERNNVKRHHASNILTGNGIKIQYLGIFLPV